MVNIQTERLRGCVNQLNAIIVEYYAETEAKEGVPPLDMDWELYTSMEEHDKFILITARDEHDGRIVGFVTYYLGFHPHYKTVMFATCGTLAVKINHRGEGIAGKLLTAAVPLLKLHDVKYITHGHRSVYDVEPIFTKHGFKLTELQFTKVI